MQNEEIISKINEFLIEEFEIEEEEIDPEANLMETLELDSLDLVDLVVMSKFMEPETMCFAGYDRYGINHSGNIKGLSR